MIKYHIYRWSNNQRTIQRSSSWAINYRNLGPKGVVVKTKSFLFRCFCRTRRRRWRCLARRRKNLQRWSPSTMTTFTPWQEKGLERCNWCLSQNGRDHHNDHPGWASASCLRTTCSTPASDWAKGKEAALTALSSSTRSTALDLRFGRHFDKFKVKN